MWENDSRDAVFANGLALHDLDLGWSPRCGRNRSKSPLRATVCRSAIQDSSPILGHGAVCRSAIEDSSPWFIPEIPGPCFLRPLLPVGGQYVHTSKGRVFWNLSPPTHSCQWMANMCTHHRKECSGTCPRQLNERPQQFSARQVKSP